MSAALLVGATTLAIVLGAGIDVEAQQSARISVSEAREIAYEWLTPEQKKLPGIELLVDTEKAEAAKCGLFDAIWDNPLGSVHINFLTVDMRTGEMWAGPNPPCEHVSSRSVTALQK
jgi:hypothetical protein